MPRWDFFCPDPACRYQTTLSYPCWEAREQERALTGGPTCPRCQERLSVFAPAPAVHFKGEGWTPKGGH